MALTNPRSLELDKYVARIRLLNSKVNELEKLRARKAKLRAKLQETDSRNSSLEKLVNSLHNRLDEVMHTKTEEDFLATAEDAENAIQCMKTRLREKDSRLQQVRKEIAKYKKCPDLPNRARAILAKGRQRSRDWERRGLRTPSVSSASKYLTQPLTTDEEPSSAEKIAFPLIHNFAATQDQEQGAQQQGQDDPVSTLRGARPSEPGAALDSRQSEEAPHSPRLESPKVSPRVDLKGPIIKTLPTSEPVPESPSSVSEASEPGFSKKKKRKKKKKKRRKDKRKSLSLRWSKSASDIEKIADAQQIQTPKRKGSLFSRFTGGWRKKKGKKLKRAATTIGYPESLSPRDSNTRRVVFKAWARSTSSPNHDQSSTSSDESSDSSSGSESGSGQEDLRVFHGPRVGSYSPLEKSYANRTHLPTITSTAYEKIQD